MIKKIFNKQKIRREQVFTARGGFAISMRIIKAKNKSEAISIDETVHKAVKIE